MFDWGRHFRFYKFWRRSRSSDQRPFPRDAGDVGSDLSHASHRRDRGVDAHAKTKHTPFGTLVVFSYEELFRTIRTHVLSREVFSGQWADDARIVYRALKEGHCFGAYNLLSSSEGFRFFLRSETGNALMGDEMPFCEDAQIEVSLPRRASIRVLRNGKAIRCVSMRRCRGSIGRR
jgi:hypothetical protein